MLGLCFLRFKHTFPHHAQKDLGAAKTSAYYSIAPFLGVAFGMLIWGERPGIRFYIALVVMIISTYFMIKDTIEL